MASWKYVILRAGDFAYPVIFPDKLVHADVAHRLRPIIPVIGGKRPRLISAGFIEDLVVSHVGGESATLDLKSRGSVDRRLINGFGVLSGICMD